MTGRIRTAMLTRTVVNNGLHISATAGLPMEIMEIGVLKPPLGARDEELLMETKETNRRKPIVATTMISVMEYVKDCKIIHNSASFYDVLAD